MNKEWNLPEDRFFDNEPSQKKAALEIYEAVKDLPIVSPHGHIDPKIFLDGNILVRVCRSPEDELRSYSYSYF